jgi:hypothetical protein
MCIGWNHGYTSDLKTFQVVDIIPDVSHLLHGEAFNVGEFAKNLRLVRKALLHRKIQLSAPRRDNRIDLRRKYGRIDAMAEQPFNSKAVGPAAADKLSAILVHIDPVIRKYAVETEDKQPDAGQNGVPLIVRLHAIELFLLQELLRKPPVDLFIDIHRIAGIHHQWQNAITG